MVGCFVSPNHEPWCRPELIPPVIEPRIDQSVFRIGDVEQRPVSRRWNRSPMIDDDRLTRGDEPNEDVPEIRVEKYIRCVADKPLIVPELCRQRPGIRPIEHSACVR